MQFCALDDAYAFLTEAKGLPSIPSASGRLRLCLRACILLSWVGLEDALDHACEHFGAKGRTIRALPARLKVRMLAFLLPLAETGLVDAEFDRFRKLRNQLAHPRAKEAAPQLTLELAERTFQFCLRMVRSLHTYRMANPTRDAQPCPAHAHLVRDVQKVLPVHERKRPVAAAATRKAAAQ